MEPYRDTRGKIRKTIDLVGDLTNDNGLQRRNVRILRKNIDNELQIIDNLIGRNKKYSDSDADSIAFGKLVMDQARQQIKTMAEVEKRLMFLRDKSVNKFTSFTYVFVLVAALIVNSKE